MYLEVFPLGPIDTNAVLLISDAGEAVLVDAPLDVASAVEKVLERHNAKLSLLLLTHSHWDHLAGAAEVKKKFNVPVWIHREDAGNLEVPGSDGLPLFFPIEGVKPDGMLEEGQEVVCGELKLKVIHTPGHTPGGVCFYLEEQKLLISGDTLFRGTIGNLSFPTARPNKMWDSLKKLAKLPPDTTVIPGHGGKTTIGRESWLSSAEEHFG